MTPWIETFGILGLAVIGFLLGHWCSRLPGRWWMAGYFVPLLFVALMAVARCIPETEFMVPFSWLMAGRTEYVITAIVATCILSAPLSRLPRLQTRRVVILFMIVLVLMIVIPPFLSPVFVRKQLQSLKTLRVPSIS